MSRSITRVARHHVIVGLQRLEGLLSIPCDVHGLVIFAHGSGSGRHSPRNQQVARTLESRGLATLLFDLLTLDEATDRANVFDIPLLGERVCSAIDWAGTRAEVGHLPIGLFGASTGAAAALDAAAARPDKVAAVVSRGGRPDLAAAALPLVRAPTLLVVGGEDHGVIELNREAYAALSCEKRLAIVPRATHLFEEPGALEQVVSLAGCWFEMHLREAAR